MRIQLGDTSVTLLAEHAVFLEESAVLVVADIHLGKSATFRGRGIPIPEGDTAYDLDKLTELVERCKPRRLVIAGDLVHAKDGMSPHVLEVFREWEEQISIPIIVTEGNHDRMARLFEHELPIEMVPSIDIDGVRITHDPDELPKGLPGIAGHLHPGVRLPESPRRSIRTPFFFLRHPHHLVLPAFSRFTGLNLQKPQSKDRVFIPLRKDVVEVPM
ncbi:MAG: ligase-associated DNA damage response endonuclease PdeM [Luteolibacter sp.]